MNNIDYVILIPILLGFIFGLFKGLVRELSSLAAIFLGIYGAKLFSPVISNTLQCHTIHNVQVANAVAYIIVFITIAILLLILSKWVDKFFEAISLSTLNKLAGGLFGALKFALVMSVLINVFDAIDGKFQLIHRDTKSNSVLYEPVKHLGPELWTEAKTYKENSMKDKNE
jgi:membrane protein required for colicin V production